MKCGRYISVVVTSENGEREEGDLVVEELVHDERLAVSVQEADASGLVKHLDGNEQFFSWIDRRRHFCAS